MVIWFGSLHTKTILDFIQPLAQLLLSKDFSKYKHATGSVRFPIDAPLLLSLIIKVVKFRVKENKKKKVRIT